MPSHLLSNSPSTAAGSSSDVVLHSSSSSAAAAVDISAAGDISAATAASSSSSSAYSRLAEMWNYLWIPFLISLSKEFGPAKAEPQPAILLPSQLHHRGDSPPRCPVPDTKLNYRPVIGIISHPGDGASGRLSNASSASYIAASYVKFVESAGARVIPIIYNEPPEIIFQVSPCTYIFV